MCLGTQYNYSTAKISKEQLELPILNNGTIHAVHILMYNVNNSTKHPKQDIILIPNVDGQWCFGVDIARKLSMVTQANLDHDVLQ